MEAISTFRAWSNPALQASKSYGTSHGRHLAPSGMLQMHLNARHRRVTSLLSLCSTQRPSRMPLLAKRTKRCPTCSHTLIRPESKPHSTRFKIKIAAINYLPGVEVGARSRVGRSPDVCGASEWHDGLTRTKISARQTENLHARLDPGNIVCMPHAEVFRTKRLALSYSIRTSLLSQTPYLTRYRSRYARYTRRFQA